MDNVIDQLAMNQTITDHQFSNKGNVHKNTGSGLRHLDPETDFKVRRITTQINETAHMAANEPSLGLFRIQEHVHRTLPQLVQRKSELKMNLTRIEDAIYDLKLSVDVIDSFSNLPHFTRIHEALKTAIETKRKLNIKAEQEQARLQFDIKNAERANVRLSQNEPAEGYICPICLIAMTSQDGLIDHWRQNHSIETFENDCFETVTPSEDIAGSAEGTSYVMKQENDVTVIDIQSKERAFSECEDVVKIVDEATASSASGSVKSDAII